MKIEYVRPYLHPVLDTGEVGLDLSANCVDSFCDHALRPTALQRPTLPLLVFG